MDDKHANIRQIRRGSTFAASYDDAGRKPLANVPTKDVELLISMSFLFKGEKRADREERKKVKRNKWSSAGHRATSESDLRRFSIAANACASSRHGPWQRRSRSQICSRSNNNRAHRQPCRRSVHTYDLNKATPIDTKMGLLYSKTHQTTKRLANKNRNTNFSHFESFLDYLRGFYTPTLEEDCMTSHDQSFRRLVCQCPS